MKSKRTRRIALWSVIALAALLSVAALVPIPPHGRFATPQIGCLADSYFEFKGGKYWHVMFSGERDRQGEQERQFIGDYRKDNGRWVVDAGDGKPVEVRATLLSLEFLEADGRRGGPFHRYWH